MTTTRRVFIDMDGVLADFVGQYKALFGVELVAGRGALDPDPPNFFENIDSNPRFFEDLPPLPNYDVLYNELKDFDRLRSPIVLTAIPKRRTEQDTRMQKIRWVRRYLGKHVRVLVCPASAKAHFGRPGDVLVDDYVKHSEPWVNMGGVFVLHKSVDATIRTMDVMFKRNGQ